MNVTFGKQQAQMSQRMQRYPVLAQWISRIFGYTLVGNYARALTFKKILRELPLASFRKVLDLGCGFGEYSFMMSEALPNAQVTALDINAKAVARIDEVKKEGKINNLNTHLGTIDTLAVEGPQFDFVFTIDVFEHIAVEEMPFQEVYKKLNPGGYFLVKIPSRDQLTILPESWFEDHHDWLEDEHIGQVYDLEGLKQRIEKEGFEVVYAAYGDGWLSRLAWEIGYLSHKAGPVLQLLCLPFAKLLVLLGMRLHRGKGGNTIQVIGRKN